MKAPSKTSLPTGGLFTSVHEAEQCYHGNLLAGENLPDDALRDVSPEIYETDTHSFIHKTINKIIEEGERPDLVNVAEKLRDVPKPDGEPWVQYLTHLTQIAPPAAELALKEIKRAAVSKKRARAAYSLYEAAQNDDRDVYESLLEELRGLDRTDEQSANPLKPISAKDLPDLEQPPSLWEGLLYPGCITQLNAEPGAGKSTIAYNIAALGALRRDFLGIGFPKRIKTLYIDLETPLWLQKLKIQRICDELPEDFHLLSELTLRRDLNHLLRLCKQEMYELIVLDTQSKVLDMEDENSNSEANRAVSRLRKIVAETGAAILLIHHTKKGTEGKDVYRGRGASAIAGAVDVVVNLETINTNTLRLRAVKSRVAEPFEPIIMNKIGKDKFERATSERDAKLEQISKAIEELSQNGDKVNQKALIEHFKGEIGETRLCKILKDCDGNLWSVKNGNSPNEKIYYLSKNVESCPPRDHDFTFLENDNDEGCLASTRIMRDVCKLTDQISTIEDVQFMVLGSCIDGSEPGDKVFINGGEYI